MSNNLKQLQMNLLILQHQSSAAFHSSPGSLAIQAAVPREAATNLARPLFKRWRMTSANMVWLLWKGSASQIHQPT
jgi:hypothetical protein